MARQIVSTAAVPAARINDLVMTESADELLVYDTANHHIHHLNRASAVIWRLCDGVRSVPAIAGESGSSEDAVRLALTKLDDAGLFETPLATAERVSGQSRRAFLRKAAVAGAIAVPTIASVSAPVAASNDSPTCGLPCATMGAGFCHGGPGRNCNNCRYPTGGDESEAVCCHPGSDPGCDVTVPSSV